MSVPHLPDVLEFLQAILAGGIAFDREDPRHLDHLRRACALLEQFQSLGKLVPELRKSGPNLNALEGTLQAEGESLLGKIDLLERLSQALEQHLGGLKGRAERLQAAPPRPTTMAWASEEAPSFEGVVAIDLGTSNVACAHWSFRKREPEVTSLEPAAVNVLDGKGFLQLSSQAYLSGGEALRHKSKTNLYRSFRRLLGQREAARPAVTGGELSQVPVRLLVAGTVRALLQNLSSRLGHDRLNFPQVVVTVPASGDLPLEYELRRVFEALGVTVSTDLDEATAACVYYLLRPVLLREVRDPGAGVSLGAWYEKNFGLEFDGTKGEMRVLCIDTGGGTTDLSLLGFSLQEDSLGCEIDINVLDTTGFPELSGEGLTLHLFGLLKRRLALAIALPRRARRLEGSGEVLGPHPWLGYHQLEAGPEDVSVERRLAEEYCLLVDHWDQVAKGDPLPDRLRAAVDHMFPTVSKGEERTGRRFRVANFSYLWEQAERLKREISDERATLARRGLEPDDPIPTVRASLDLSGYPVHPYGLDVSARIGLSPAEPMPEVLSLSSRDVDAYVSGRAPLLQGALQRLCQGMGIARVLLAGNGSQGTRFAVEQQLRSSLNLSEEQVTFDPEEAKPAVVKGACLWAMGSRFEGIQVFLNRKPRCPADLFLLSAVNQELLFSAGQPINRFCFAQPPHREGAQGEKLIMLGRQVGDRPEPFLMFDPRQGTPLPDIRDLPITRRRDVVVKNVDKFLGFTVKGNLTEFFLDDPAEYVQLDTAMVTQMEIMEILRNEMTMEEVIAWIEGAQHLQLEPPAEHAFHRYYLDDNREVHLVYHAKGQKLLCRGQIIEHSHELPEQQDPFSGVH